MHGGLVQGPFYLNDFFGETPEANTSDPRVYFDADTGRWYATMLEYSFNDDFTAVTESHVDVAVSDSGDPTGSWHVYRVDASSPTHRGCPCLGDYPILGVDGINVYISTQEFTSDLESFNGAQLYILPKSRAGRRRGLGPPRDVREPRGRRKSLAFRVQFANQQKPAPAEFAMSTLDPTGAGDNRIAVWAVTHRGAVARGGMPSLSSRVISSEGYFPPPPTQTPPGFCDVRSAVARCGCADDRPGRQRPGRDVRDAVHQRAAGRGDGHRHQRRRATARRRPGSAGWWSPRRSATAWWPRPRGCRGRATWPAAAWGCSTPTST